MRLYLRRIAPVFSSFILLGWAFACALCASGQAQAGPYVVSSNGTMVFDHKSGLIWMRCSMGSSWDGSQCVGKPRQFEIKNAIMAVKEFNAARTTPGRADWRMPALNELADLRFCSKSWSGDRMQELTTGAPRFTFLWAGPSIPKECRNGNSVPAIDTVFSNTPPHYFWTSSIAYYNEKFMDEVAAVSFQGGELRRTVLSSSATFFQIPKHHLRLVRSSWMNDKVSASDIDKQEFWFADDNKFNEAILKLKAASTQVIWKQADYVDQKSYRGFAGLPNLVPAATLLADQNLSRLMQGAPVVRAEPEPRAAILEKSEFETTAQFTARKEAVQAAAELELINDRKAREREISARDQFIAEARKKTADPGNYQAAVNEAWAELLGEYLNNPELTDIQYDADEQVFRATLTSRTKRYKQTVTSRASLAEAPRLKEDLLSGKIAPVVIFNFSGPDVTAEWVLKENAQLRARRFSDSKDNTNLLLAAIKEYPDSQEAGRARARVYELVKTSAELVLLLDLNPTWQESKAAKPRLPALQLKEYNEAVRDGSSSAYKSFLAAIAGADTQGLKAKAEKAMQAAQAREERESRESAARWERDRPQREARERARNSCQNQVNTCIASCPRFYSEISKAYTDIPDGSCKSRCESVSCNY